MGQEQDHEEQDHEDDHLEDDDDHLEGHEEEGEEVEVEDGLDLERDRVVDLWVDSVRERSRSVGP